MITWISKVARSIFYDKLLLPTNLGDTVQEAIDALYPLAVAAKNASRGFVMCSFDGNASSGRWLEFGANNPSNNSPFIVPEPSIIRAISFGTTNISTCTLTLYVNGVAATTISTSASNSNRNKTLSISINDLDRLSARVTAGSGSRPQLFIFIQTL